MREEKMSQGKKVKLKTSTIAPSETIPSGTIIKGLSDFDKVLGKLIMDVEEHGSQYKKPKDGQGLQ